MMCLTSSPYSDGLPRRCGNGTCPASDTRAASGSEAIMGVFMMPGAIVHERMPWVMNSRARTIVSARMAPLLLAYEAWPTWPSNAATDAVLMSTPRSPAASVMGWFTISAATCLQTLKVPTTFTSSTLRNSSSGVLSARLAVAMPAQLTAPLMVPNAFLVSAIARATSASEVTSP
eukprot:Amastigsp_a3795_64.p3 type:complete len:175 gc:universal Amastigsp_a3795_64:80-604(+)